MTAFKSNNNNNNKTKKKTYEKNTSRRLHPLQNNENLAILRQEMYQDSKSCFYILSWFAQIYT